MIPWTEPLTLRRATATSVVVRGRPQPAPREDSTFYANVQDAPGRVRSPESRGHVVRDRLWLATYTELLPPTNRQQLPADIVVIDGREYIVKDCAQVRELWPHFEATVELADKVDVTP